MTLEDQSRPGPGGSETSTDGVATILEALCPLYLVLLVSRNGNWIRKPYLSLHSAQAALKRAEERRQPSRLVLCRVQPVEAALELGSEVGS